MSTTNHPLSCYLIGDESLLIQCAETWLSKGHVIFGVVSENARIADWATEWSLPIINPHEDLAARLSRDPFDYLLSITNRRMLPGSVLTLAGRASINFHDGPLPGYAGLNTPVWALLAGEPRHGVTWHIMEDGPDTGDILEQSSFDLAPDERALTLNTKCYEAGIESFTRLVDGLTDDTVRPVKQDLGSRGYYGNSKRPPLSGTIVWSDPAEEIARLTRALDFGNYPNPVAVAKVLTPNGLFRAATAEVSDTKSDAPPGTIVAIDSRALTISTGTNDIRLTESLTLAGEPLTPPDLARRFILSERDCLPSIDEARADRLNELAVRLARSESVWSRKLASSRLPDLPFVDRSAAPSTDQSIRPFQLPPEAETATRDTLVAGIAAYIARLTGQQEFDLAYRDPTLIEAVGDLTPWFVDQVPVRIRTETHQGFGVFIDAFVAELETTRQRLAFPRDLIGRNPNLSAATERPTRLPVGVEVRDDDDAPLPEPVGEDLTIVLSGAGRKAWWIYDGGRLSVGHLESMEQQLAAFLTNTLSHPDRPSEAVPLLSPEDLDRVLVQWNSTDRPIPDGRCVHQLIEEQAARTPNHPALIAGPTSMTYGELNARANQLARLLGERGVGNETLVGVCLDRRETMLVALLAVLKAGAAYVPLDPTYPEQRLAFMVNDAACGALLTESHHRRCCPRWTHRSCASTRIGTNSRRTITPTSTCRPATSSSATSSTPRARPGVPRA